MTKETNLGLDYIDFKLAKVLKTKGFDIIETYGNVSSLYDKKGNHVLYSNYGFMLSGINDGYISAPSQSIVLKWLRVVHDIHIKYVITLDNTFVGYMSKQYKPKGYIETRVKECNTPDEAINNTIKYVLKELI
jgi:hypothetical protein